MLPQALLKFSFVEFSSTWSLPFQLKKKRGAGEHREIHDVEQTKKITPFITREITFGKQISELVFGIKKFDLDFGVEVVSVNQSVNATL